MSDREPDLRPDCPPDGVLLGVPPLPEPDPPDEKDEDESTTPKPSQ